MEQVELTIAKREDIKKQRCRASRAEGFLPGVVYGRHSEPIPIQMRLGEFSRAISTPAGKNIIFNLKLGEAGPDDTIVALMAEYQKDPMGKKFIHVDFKRISLTEKVRAKVPVILVGDCAGARLGGIIDHVLWELEIEALPTDIPNQIVVDIAHLGMDEAIHVRDITLPDSVLMIANPEDAIVLVHSPRAVEEPAPVEGALAAAPEVAKEPEVIAKGKKEEEEE